MDSLPNTLALLTSETRAHVLLAFRVHSTDLYEGGMRLQRQLAGWALLRGCADLYEGGTWL